MAKNRYEAPEVVLALLRERAPTATICPSEVARKLAAASHDWREQMPSVHEAVDYLLERGEIELSWKGKPMTKREGPYRIGLAKR